MQDYRLRYQLDPLVKEDLLQKEEARVRATVSAGAAAVAAGAFFVARLGQSPWHRQLPCLLQSMW